MNEATHAAPESQAQHPLRQLWRRYAQVFGAAWQARHQLAGPPRLADEAAFLPAALSLQETSPHPAPRRAIWVLIGLCCAALAWSIVGQVDIVSVAEGRIVVSDRSKTIQPLQAAVVRAIHVRDGARVRAGDLLLELDPTEAGADARSVGEQQEATARDLRRAEQLLVALAQGRLVGAANTEADAELRADWADIQARLARLDAEAARRAAGIDTARQGITRLEASLQLVRRREADLERLSAEGFLGAHAAQDKQRERIELERDLSTQRARERETEAALAETRRTRDALLAETRRQLSDRQAQARLQRARLQQEALKQTRRETLTRLLAPVDGTVQQLAVHTEGGVVTPAQALMVIVPDGAVLQAEVVVANKDVGFVHAGQAAVIKVETFAFTRYGTVPAQVRQVSADAVVDEKRGALYLATVALERDHLAADGRRFKLAAGMNVTAEIKTGRRRVIEFLLSPIQRTVNESGRER